MIPIKIECGCGQRYAFDVEVVNGQIPNPVACPSCGMDGTAAANSFISQSQPAVFPTSISIARPAAAQETQTAPTGRGGYGGGRQIDTIQLTHEARAKMMWGDSKEDVIKFLMIQGLPRQEAIDLAQALFLERAATVRANGVRKVITGAAMMCVPMAAFFGFRALGYFPLKLFGLAGAVGVWGAYRVLKGTFMIIAPKSEPGDVSEQ